MSKSEGGLSRIELRLQNALRDKKFYEAQQIYKTLSYRAINKNDFAEAIRVLREGSNLLLSSGDDQGGTDLACMIVNVFVKHKQPFKKCDLTILCSLLYQMKPRSDERDNFIAKVFDLIAENGELQAKFNEYLARKYWQEKSLLEARRCIMMTKNGALIGSFMSEFHKSFCLPSEADLVIAQAVLQILCLKQPSVAEYAFCIYAKLLPEPGPPFMRYPLLNFLWFLLLAVRHKHRGSVFSVLCDKYQVHLERDPEFADYLERIGCTYFGFRPKTCSNRPPNLLGNIMGLLSNDGFQDIFNMSSSVDLPAFQQSASNALSYEDVE